MDGEHLDLGAGLLAHRRVALLAAGLRLGLQEAHDRAQRGGAGGLVGARDVEHLPEVGDVLVAGGAQAERGSARVRSKSAAITSLGGSIRRQAVEGLQDREDAADEVGVAHVGADGRERVQDAAAGHELEDVVVRQAEERRAQRGEHGQAVGGIVDRAQDGGQRLHLLARVVLLAADQPVRDAAAREVRPRRADELAASSCGRAGRRRPGRAGRTASPSRMLHGRVRVMVLDEAGDGVGQDGADGLDVRSSVRRDDGQRAARSSARRRTRPRRGRRRADAAAGSPGSLKTASKRSLTKARTDGHGPEVRGEGQHFPTGGHDQALRPRRRSRCRRGGSGRCSAWGRRRRRACRAPGARSRQSVAASAVGSSARKNAICACSGSVSWNSSIRTKSKRRWK